MSSPYVGEIRMFGGNFAPVGWMLCQGQLLPISEYETLFNLIGTTYGGDGQNTFALPDLQSRIPLHQGGGYVIGESLGTETVALTAQQLPSHSHPLSATTDAASSASTPVDALANTGAISLYGTPANNVLDAAMSPTGAVGGSSPHENMAPYLCINFIISLFGVFPSQN
jgi:microcystin-dependent protein